MYHDQMDADILTAQLHALGRRDSALRKRGICSHGWSQGQAPCKCLHCGKVFPTFDAMCAERREILN